ncbi:MAG: molybdopterin converting factor subunit 1 [Rhodospirillales bacterium]|nr:molybdopterin converting factor subunit 1 [Rhodospirillales bacterium]MDE2573738.1 molybdopterin converting factor subunit 1 [Rhodospirillales bacterium]
MGATAAPLHILYFAWLRERVGLGAEEVTPPPGIATVGALAEWLAGRSPGHGAAFAQRASIRCAVNQDFAGPDTAIHPGDEVAFFPPVTGG